MARPRANLNRPVLPDEWRELGLSILKALGKDNELGKDEEHYRNKEIKQRFLDAISSAHIIALINHAQIRFGIDQDDVARRLGLDPGTPNRWLTNQVQPHARTFFGILIVALREFGVGLRDVEFPRNREIIREGVRRTLGIILKREISRSRNQPTEDEPRSRNQPTEDEFAIVRSFMRHPEAGEMAPLAGMNANPRVVDKILFDVVRQRHGVITDLEVARRALRDARDAISKWAEAYALFLIGLPTVWEFLDEDAV